MRNLNQKFRNEIRLLNEYSGVLILNTGRLSDRLTKILAHVGLHRLGAGGISDVKKKKKKTYF